MYLENEWQLLPMKPEMAAILDLFFSETLKILITSEMNFSINNHVEMRYYINILCLIVQKLQLHHSAWQPFWICKKNMFRSGKNLGTFHRY